MKILEQTVKREIEDSSGEYENTAERNTPNRLADVVPDVIYDVTPLKFQFLAPRMDIKNCNHTRSSMKKPRQLPRVRACNKNTALVPGRPEDPGVVTRESRGAHPARYLAPSSPNCSPLVYFLRGVRGQWTKKSNCNNKGDLRVRASITLGSLL